MAITSKSLFLSMAMVFTVSPSWEAENNSSCNFMKNKPCSSENINFFLYTRPDTEQMGEILLEPEAIVNSSDFQPKNPTKIVIHGFTSSMYEPALVDIRKAYLSTGPHNIIAVDWSKYSNGSACYIVAVSNAKYAGRCVSFLVETLRSYGADDIHVIGFSLGAQVAGLMANYLGDYQVKRISGLDPAMPLFMFRGPRGRLDPSDAIFVDVIHTDSYLEGMAKRSGHMDHYANGGILQPGCGTELRAGPDEPPIERWDSDGRLHVDESVLKNAKFMNTLEIRLTIKCARASLGSSDEQLNAFCRNTNNASSCSHHRAPMYFAESITSSKGFWGWSCPSMTAYAEGKCPHRGPAVLMGAHADPSRRGTYVVETAAQSPYALGKRST